MLFEKLLVGLRLAEPPPSKQLYTWGLNSNEQLGIASISDQSNRGSPVQVNTRSWTRVTTGGAYTMAIRSDGTLWGWGYFMDGALGHGGVDFSIPVSLGTRWPKVAFGSDRRYQVGIGTDGALYTWGGGGGSSGSSSGRGAGSAELRYPGQVLRPAAEGGGPFPAGTSWVAIAGGTSGRGEIRYAIRDNGWMYAWGETQGAGPGTGFAQSFSTELPFPDIIRGPLDETLYVWKDVVFGKSFGIALRQDGSIWGWGVNGDGQIADETLQNRVVPKKIGNSSWTAIAAGWNNAIGVDATGRLFAWGAGTNGALGNLTTTRVSSPVLVSGPASTSWAAVSVGLNTCYAITTAGRLYAWGAGTSGALGDNTVVSKSSPVLVSGPAGASWSAVAAGRLFAVALTTTGQLYAWGVNTGGQLGDNSITSKSSPVLVSGPASTSWATIAASDSHAMAITTTGQLYAWGVGTGGQLGDLSVTTKSSPVLVSGPASTSWVKIGATVDASYATTVEGRLYAWGSNAFGQLGDSTTVGKSSPVLVSGPAATSWIAIGRGMKGDGDTTLGQAMFALAKLPAGLDTEGYLYSWGNDFFGFSGTNGNGGVSAPAIISDSMSPNITMSWHAIGAAYSTGTFLDFAYGIDSNFRLYAWGNGVGDGRLGRGSNLRNTFIPALVSGPAGASWSVVSGGLGCGYAITTEGRLYAWGLNTNGRLGDNSTTNRSSPVLVSGPAGASWASVSGHRGHALGLTTDGRLYAWGLNDVGQLGDNTTVSKSSPVLVSGPAGASWAAVRAGFSASAAITTDGRLYAWGLNTNGRLGDGTTVNKSSPVLVSGPAGVTWTSFPSTIGSTFGAYTSTGELYVWGQNTDAQIMMSFSSPVQIGTSSWSTIAAGPAHTLGITVDGRLFAWGRNDGGALGDATTTQRFSPVLVSGPATTSWSFVAAGGSRFDLPFSYGITTEGILYAWGLASTSASAGALGIGNFNNVTVNTPVEVLGPMENASSSWNMIAFGAGHAIGLKSDGSIWTWGFGAPALGQNRAIPDRAGVPIRVGTSSYTFVSAGNETSFAIDINGRLFAWGVNTNGRLGDNSTTSRSSPVLVSGPAGASWTSVSAGGNFALGITSVGRLYAWGENGAGMLGDNTTANKISPVLVSGPTSTSWSYVGTGASHAMAITTLGRLYAWGLGTSGQLGDLSITSKSSPVLVSGPAATSWSAVRGGVSHSVGLTTTGQLYAWGGSGSGQLGDTSTVTKSSPVLVSGPVGLSWSVINAGDSSSYAITTEGRLYAWGDGSGGTLGNLDIGNRNSPVLVSGPVTTSWTILAMGPVDSISSFDANPAGAITSIGALYTWGAADGNAAGSLGHARSTDNKSSPVIVLSTTPRISWTVVSAGNQHTIGIGVDGKLYAWGRNITGNLGFLNAGSGSLAPQEITSPSVSWTSVAAGRDHSLGITTTGILYGWGLNASGQVGDGTITDRSEPTLVAAPGTINSWRALSFGGGFAVGIQSDYSLWAWGLNTNGQLGDNTATDKSRPVKIGSSSWSVVGTSQNNTYGITVDGRLFAWGVGTSGQLGDLSITSKSSPVLVSGPAGASWTTVSGGSNQAYAITTEGRLYAWGVGTNGRLGDSTTTAKSSPVLVSGPAGVSWTVVAANDGAGYAITTEGRLYAWGLGTSGQLGDLTLVTKSSPVLVSGPASTSWISISAGGTGTAYAITTEGRLYAWGLGTSGQLGDLTLVTKSSPVLVSGPAGVSWSVVASSTSHAAAITTTGQLYAWGAGTNGALGDNTATTKSSPVLVSGPATTSWVAVYGGSNSTSHGAIPPTLPNVLYVWGTNTNGQLGLSDTTARSAPVYVTTPMTTYSWSVISAGASHSTGILTDGTLHTWGLNTSLQLGLNSIDTNIRRVPTQVLLANTSWSAVSSGVSTFHTAGITS